MRTPFLPVLLALLLAAGQAAQPVAAQTAAPPAVAASAADATGVSERVRRQAERPYYWIRLQSQRGGTAAVNAAAGTTAAGTPAAARRAGRADEPPLAATATPAAAAATTAVATARPTGAVAPEAGTRPADPAAATRLDRALASLAQEPPAAGPPVSLPDTGSSTRTTNVASPASASPGLDTAGMPPAVLATSDESARPASAVSSSPLPTPAASPSAGPAAAGAAPAGQTAPAGSALTLPTQPTSLAASPAVTATSPGSTTPPSAIGLPSPTSPEPTPAEAARRAADEPAGPLQVLRQVEAQFPAAWMQRLRKGEVEVHIDIAPDGSVQSATVERSSHRRLEEAALNAVRAWRFAPLAGPRDAVIVLSFDLDR